MERDTAEYQEFIQDVADAIKPLMPILDRAALMFGPQEENLTLVLENMKDTTSTLSALPFPETMDKAEVMRLQNQQFELIIQLIQSRFKGMQLQMKQRRGSPGDEVLRQMGLA